MDRMYCEKVGKPEDKQICVSWFRDEGICRDCLSYDLCKHYAEKDSEKGE